MARAKPKRGIMARAMLAPLQRKPSIEVGKGEVQAKR